MNFYLYIGFNLLLWAIFFSLMNAGKEHAKKGDRYAMHKAGDAATSIIFSIWTVNIYVFCEILIAIFL